LTALLLTALAAGCYGIAAGVFYVLHSLERPVYASLVNDTIDAAVMSPSIRVLLVLQQFHKQRIPLVVSVAMFLGLVSSSIRVVFHHASFLSIIVVLMTALVLSFAAIVVPPALRRLSKTVPEDPFPEIQATLVPLLSLHRNGAVLASILLLLQVADTTL